MKRMREWAPRPLALTAVAAAAVAFVAHAWQALPAAYLGPVSGIWLALGHDLAHGVFYRDLVSPLGYGGTRYFPLFFTMIGGFLRAGATPLVAGWLASAVAAAVLAGGLARVARVLGAPRHVVWLAALGALAPYFVQQTLFELRADAMAAGLNLWGLAAIIPAFRHQRGGDRPHIGSAAAWFTLAFATKVTSLVVPGSVGLALLLTRRFKTAFRFGAAAGAGIAVFLLAVHVASNGRAIPIWRACMFMGSGNQETLHAWLSGEFIALARHSHLIVGVSVLSAAALAALAVLEWRPAWTRQPAGISHGLTGSSLWMPVTLFAAVSAATAFTLSSPGTVPSNHVVEWLMAGLVVLLWAAAARVELRGVCSVALVALVLWMAAQDGARAWQLRQATSGRATAAVRQEIIGDLVAQAAAPVFSESALWPTLAGQSAFVLDPFALRVVMSSRPDIARDLASKLESQFFARVMLTMDPTSERGRGFYENAHLGWPTVSRILSRYRLESHPAPDVFVFVPRARDGQ